VKSLVLLADDRPVVVLVPGDRRADTGKVAKAVGASAARVARPPEVEAATGFEPGAVAPFPLPRVDRVFVDRGLLRYDRVWVGAGSPRHIAGLPSSELLRLARAQPMDAVQDGA
jgi:Cys-tRNA(Pro)/Cys-tRNA(Cys) deacylase